MDILDFILLTITTSCYLLAGCLIASALLNTYESSNKNIPTLVEFIAIVSFIAWPIVLFAIAVVAPFYLIKEVIDRKF